MEEKTQGGMGKLPNTPSNRQKALQPPKSVSLSCKMRNGPNAHEQTRLKTHFFNMSAMPPLSLVSLMLNARFYELNGAQPHFPILTLVVLCPSSSLLSRVALSSNFPLLNLGQFDNIMYLKHWA